MRRSCRCAIGLLQLYPVLGELYQTYLLAPIARRASVRALAYGCRCFWTDFRRVFTGCELTCLPLANICWFPLYLTLGAGASMSLSTTLGALETLTSLDSDNPVSKSVTISTVSTWEIRRG